MTLRRVGLAGLTWARTELCYGCRRGWRDDLGGRPQSASGPGSFLAGALSSVKRQEVLARAFEYWRNIDTTIGQKIQTAANVSNPTVRIVGTGRRTAR